MIYRDHRRTRREHYCRVSIHCVPKSYPPYSEGVTKRLISLLTKRNNDPRVDKLHLVAEK